MEPNDSSSGGAVGSTSPPPLPDGNATPPPIPAPLDVQPTGETPRPTSIANVPPMTDEEYARIRTQFRLIWITTFISVPIAVVMTRGVLIFDILGVLIFAAVLHIIARAIFRDGNKGWTGRYRNYKRTYELNKFKAKSG